MNTLKGLGSDIKLRSIKQVSASLLADDDVPDTLLDWTSEFAGQWEDDRTADEVIEDIRGARTSNREIQQLKSSKHLFPFCFLDLILVHSVPK